jgi:hypothetical protein
LAATLNDVQAEVFGHRVEVAVVVQQPMTSLDTERTSDHVDRLAHRYSSCPQTPIISRRSHRDLLVQHSSDRILPEFSLDTNGMSVIPRTLQYLEQNQIANQKLVVGAVSQHAEPEGRGIVDATKVGDPNRTVDDDHEF